MKTDEYQYLEATLTGRRARDPEFEARMNVAVDPRVEERQRLVDSKTPEQREIEQRRYSLDTYGPEHMRRYARPIISEKPLGELAVEGDQILGSASTQQLKGHSAAEKPEPWRNPDGSLRLQNHGACPQRQVLQIVRA